jgi:hypothetical protein
MSDLSERLSAALNNIGAKDTSQWVNTNKAEWIKDTPGFEGFQRHNAMTVVRALRRVYRRECGKEFPQTPQEALDRTEGPCTEKLLPVCRAAFADGVQVGHGISHAVKKFSFFKKLDEVFDHDGFREESELFQVTVQMDYAANEEIERYFKAASIMIAGASGFTSITEKHTLNRVWDLWALACNSASTGLFLAGVQVGKEWREKDTLSGILAATEKGSSNGE